MADIDEDALNLLLLQGVDFSTALAASIRDEPKPPSEPPSEPRKRDISTLGWRMLAAIFIAILLLRLFSA